MRKYLLFLLCLCVHGMARGQTGFDYRYWYDNDESKVLTGHSDTGQWQMDIDLAGLSEALHAVHIQVIDSKGNMSSPVTRHFLKLRSRNVREGYYWFETDSKARKLMGQIQGAFQIDVTALPQGFHTIYFQMVGEDGTLSSVTSRSFYKVTVPKSLNYRCWVDDDLSTLVTGKHTGAPILIDLTDVTEGFHVLRTQIEGSSLSSVVSRPFMKLPQVDGMEYMRCICSVDNQPFLEENVPAAGGIVHWNFDVSTLPYGFHRIQVKVMMPTGAATSTYDSFFLRIPTTQEMNDLKCVYAIDGAEYHTEAGSMNDGVFHCDLDVAHLSDGLHRIVYKLSNGKGVETKTQTQFFVKTPVGGNGIVEYHYWLNDSVDQVSRVRLDHPVTPYQLVTMLPLPKHPIHSSLFQFEIDGGKPVVYARNNIHIRFFDASERFTDASAEFVDYSVRQEVTDIERLISGVRATTPKPVGDDIKWYQLDAEPGDSLRFKLDRAATVQLFAPSGEEVFSGSGYDVVNWFGCHVNESGTYYVALHDVTAQQGNEINVDYFHIDKYAVLWQDVNVVGNGGCSTITFEGNGFRDLYAIDFYNEKGDTIHHVNIGHESNALTTVLFDFTDATIGSYNAIFHFTGEDKLFKNIVTVEEARDIELAMTVSYPSLFLKGRGKTTYTANIVNKGNMTSYRTPIYIYVSSHQKDGISKIKTKGLDLPGIFDGVACDSLTEEDKNLMVDIDKRIGDTHYFILSVTYDEYTKDSVYTWAAYFFTDIAPKSTKTIDVDVFTYDNVEVWITVPQTNNSIVGKKNSKYVKARRTKRKMTSEEYCCIRGKIECIASIVADVTSIASDLTDIWSPGTPWDVGLSVASCLADAINQIVSATGEVLCDQNDNVEEKLWENIKKITNGISVINTLSKCASKLMPNGKLRDFLKAISAITDGDGWISAFGIAIDFQGCEEAFTKEVPNCPPKKHIGGGPSNPVNSFDPNDIFGYLAESGSKAVRDSLYDVNYTIEFENDAEFATAPAHDIYITDTLDTQKFDLSTFAPTRIMIGKKSMELTGEKDFVATMDMRPAINSIAKIEGSLDMDTGIFNCHISSLDPMTMESTTYIGDGVLPINSAKGTYMWDYDDQQPANWAKGTYLWDWEDDYTPSGIGELSFNISLKSKLAHGTEVDNRAGIVFDINDVIMTPTWTNVIDKIAPVSRVIDVTLLNDSTACVNIDANDDGSGTWRYDVYVQYGEGSGWWRAAENVPIDSIASVRVYDSINHGFYVLVTDSAGNLEKKEEIREFVLDMSDPNAIEVAKIDTRNGETAIYDLQGRRVEKSALRTKGIYIVTNKKTKVKKVVRP